MNAETINHLIDGVTRAVTMGQAHLVYQACNVLIKQLDRVNVDNIGSPETAARFIQGKELVRSWGTDIRRADLRFWPNVADALKCGLANYAEPLVENPSGSFLRNLLGYDFVETYGAKFAGELMSYFEVSHEGDIEWKREMLSALWRFYESHRTEVDVLNPVFRKRIGHIMNEFTVRHDNKQQKTNQFIKSHSERDYERLLDTLASVLLTAFSNLNLTKVLTPRLNELLDQFQSWSK